MGLQTLWEIAFFPRPEVERWPSDIGSSPYGWPTLATAGLFVTSANAL